MAEKSYQVLARKYRPTDFSGLIGQDSLVQTLSNAIKTSRIAHGFLLTGIRGVGKTTTARIIAKTVNCLNIEYEGKLVKSCGKCDNCTRILMNNHPDIYEMDAASRTGVSDIRDLIETLRYLPLIAKYKIYIIDEVHMLSTSAFNALLKTLEEPPSHVKFIFATTEVRKIPITIISRCQSFDLKRISTEVLSNYLEEILEKEGIKAEKPPLNLIAEYAGGSARDALSLLDQAISHSENIINVETVKEMLGISSKHELLALFAAIVDFDTANALKILRKCYDNGGDPAIIIEDLLSLVHTITKYKIVPDIIDNLFITELEQKEIINLANKLDIARLTIYWQMLLKSITEVKNANIPINVAEIVIIKLAYAATLPTPYDIVSNKLGAPELPSKINNFNELAKLFLEKKEMVLHHYLTEDVRLIKFENGSLEFEANKDLPANFIQSLKKLLEEWTGQKWQVIVSNNKGCETIKDQAIAQKENIRKKISEDGVIKNILDNFPGSTILEVAEPIT